MDREEVTEFLGQVPLLQCLPGSSIRRIAEAVQVKHYEPGDYVAREGEPVDGLCIILDGQAEVSAPANTEEANRPDYMLNKYDYFGYGTNSSVHQVNVTAVTKLTCFVLPSQYGHLLQTKTIWNAEETPENHSLLEQILHLEKLEVDIFRGFTLPGAPTFRQVFGGQLIGQALAAASKTVDCLKLVHSLHAIFLIAGDNNMPIIYQVHRERDGTSFATRKVEAKQKGFVIFTLIVSFQKEELGFEHQAAIMPVVPPPEQLLNMEEIRERRLTDPRFPMQYRNSAAKKKFVPWPIEMRFCEDSTSQHKPSLHYWFRARGKLSDDPALHRCVVAYASDLLYSGVSLNPHRERGLKTYSLSLDHSMWFHKPVKADDWLLYVIDSPSAHGGRGFVTGRMFNRQGEVGCPRNLNSPGAPKYAPLVAHGPRNLCIARFLKHLEGCIRGKARIGCFYRATLCALAEGKRGAKLVQATDGGSSPEFAKIRREKLGHRLFNPPLPHRRIPRHHFPPPPFELSFL